MKIKVSDHIKSVELVGIFSTESTCTVELSKGTKFQFTVNGDLTQVRRLEDMMRNSELLKCTLELDSPYQFIDYDNMEVNVMVSIGGCNHDMKPYQGLTESYKYCTKCDHKEMV